MAQRPHIIKNKSGKPSKILMALALIFAVSLPYILVKNFAHHEESNIIDEESYLATAPELGTTIEMIDWPIEEQTASTTTETNLTTTTKTPVKEKPQNMDNIWQTVNPRPGDSMASIFHRLGLSAKNLHEVIQNNPHAKVLTAIKPGQSIKFLISKGRLEKLVIPVNYVDTLAISREKNKYTFHIDSKQTTTKNLYVTAQVKDSLYTTAQRTNIPSKYISKMTELFKREIDFSHGSHTGDQISIIYEAFFIGNRLVGTGDMLAVSYKSSNKTVQALRYKNKYGTIDYYTPEGNSFKKAFSRYPIRFSHISSTFALSRYHPILHYKRAHKGIDLAAPIGTPIQSTGDGVITIIDRHNGYGNMIKIKHDNKYSTLYGHMLKFQKGLSKGSKVKRGQVIGYVGQTGLASGPHCHFELHVNNQPKNPTTTALPTSSPISSREMQAFKTKIGTLLARLKQMEKTTIASTYRKNKKLG